MRPSATQPWQPQPRCLPGSQRHRWPTSLIIYLLFTFLAILHLAYLFGVALPERFLAPHDEMFHGLPLSGDEGDYVHLGYNLARQGVFGYGEHAVLTARRPPLWPLVLAGLFRFTDNPVYLLICNHLLAALAAVLAAILASGLFSRRLSLLIMVVVGLNPNSYSFVRLYAEPLFTVLLLLVMIFWTRTRLSPRRRDPVCLGLAAGLLALTRAEGLILIVLLALDLFYQARLDRPRTPALLCFLLAALLPLTPWLARNYTTMGFVGLVSNAGEVFAGAHNDKILATDPGRWLHFDAFASPAQLAQRQQLSEIEYNRQAWQLGWENLSRHPVLFLLTLEMKKLLITFSPYFVLLPPTYPPIFNTLTALPYSLLWLLFLILAGRWLILGEPWRVFLLPFLVPLLVTLIFYGIVRFRVPYEPLALTLTVGCLADWLSTRWTARRPATAPPKHSASSPGIST